MYPTGTVTFKFADTGNVLGTAKEQTFGSTAALATQASIAVSTLSEATCTLQASYSWGNLSHQACRNLPTGVDVALERHDAHDQPGRHRREQPSGHLV